MWLLFKFYTKLDLSKSFKKFIENLSIKLYLMLEICQSFNIMTALEALEEADTQI